MLNALWGGGGGREKAHISGLKKERGQVGAGGFIFSQYYPETCWEPLPKITPDLGLPSRVDSPTFSLALQLRSGGPLVVRGLSLAPDFARIRGLGEAVSCVRLSSTTLVWDSR